MGSYKDEVPETWPVERGTLTERSISISSEGVDKRKITLKGTGGLDLDVGAETERDVMKRGWYNRLYNILHEWVIKRSYTWGTPVHKAKKKGDSTKDDILVPDCVWSTNYLYTIFLLIFIRDPDEIGIRYLLSPKAQNNSRRFTPDVFQGLIKMFSFKLQ